MPDIRAQLLTNHPHRAVVEAGVQVFEWEREFLHDRLPEGRQVWQFVAPLLVARSLQLQRVILDGVTIGYDEEIEPVARAMASVVVTLTAIGHGNRVDDWNRRALRYVTFGSKALSRELRYNARARWISPALRSSIEADSRAATKKTLDNAALQGLAPMAIPVFSGVPKKDRRTDTWSGLSDAGLFKRMGVSRWYHHFYTHWSAGSHAQPSSLVPLVESRDHEAVFALGPHRRSPWFLLLATSEFGFQTLVQVNKLYRLHEKQRLKNFWNEAQSWLSQSVPEADRPMSRTRPGPR